MPTTETQRFILQPPHISGLSLSFDLAVGASARDGLAALAVGFERDWGNVGIGEPLAKAVGRDVAGLRCFPAMAAPGCGVPSTQRALWAIVTGPDQGAVFDLSRKLGRLLAGSFTLADSLPTFVYADSRDLTGYVDGTENPKGDAAAAAAIVADGNGMAGSSFVAVQRWQHDLAHFNRQPQKRRDDIIGRRLSDNEELEDAPASAHVKRSAQESYDPPAFMVRRSMPWAAAGTQGLEFIAYVSALDTFERMMRRMAGLDDGTVDALFEFSRPITGGYYWCPPFRDGRLDLRILGL